MQLIFCSQVSLCHNILPQHSDALVPYLHQISALAFAAIHAEPFPLFFYYCGIVITSLFNVLQSPTAVCIPQHMPLHQFVACRCRAPCSAWWRCASHSPTLLLPSARFVSPAVARVASCHCRCLASAAKVSNVRRHVISGRTWLTVCPHIRGFTLYSAMKNGR